MKKLAEQPKAYAFTYHKDGRYLTHVIVETTKERACKMFLKYLANMGLNMSSVMLVLRLRATKKNRHFLTHEFIKKQNAEIMEASKQKEGE